MRIRSQFCGRLSANKGIRAGSGGLLFFLLAELSCSGQSTIETRIFFDSGPPLPGLAFAVLDYYESGMLFRPINQEWIYIRRGGAGSSYPENGTTFLQSGPSGSSLAFNLDPIDIFDLVSFDLAERSGPAPADTVRVVGYRHDGTVVSRDIALDGIIDGTGPLADFETITFDESFRDLDRVEIPISSWSLDNLVVSQTIPEPTALSTFLVGLVLFGAAQWWRAARSSA